MALLAKHRLNWVVVVVVVFVYIERRRDKTALIGRLAKEGKTERSRGNRSVYANYVHENKFMHEVCLLYIPYTLHVIYMWNVHQYINAVDVLHSAIPKIIVSAISDKAESNRILPGGGVAANDSEQRLQGMAEARASR